MMRPPEPGTVAVLVVEDDETIGRHLRLALTGHGYTTTWCRTGHGALAHLRSAPCEVVLLDLGLPDVDGVEVARQARIDHPELLIVMITARSHEIDVISGLDAGADDYLAKPFTVAVLLARLRAHLRRRPTSELRPAALEVGDLVLDARSRRCLVAGVEIALRPKEFDLLEALALRVDDAMTRDQLMAEVWDENWHGSTKTLDVTVASLRRRLEAGARPGVSLPTIVTLRGHGYRLEGGGTVQRR